MDGSSPHLETGDAHATLVELATVRLICQPVRPKDCDYDDEAPIWTIALRGRANAECEGIRQGKRHIYHLLGEYTHVQNGFFIAGDVRATFFTSEDEPTPDSHVQELQQFLSLHALWANQAMWDHLASALRTLAALIPHASEEVQIPRVPPKLSLLPFGESDSTD